jgi:1-acyl-sn-glycerol-3-phosphate acyltransferase
MTDNLKPETWNLKPVAQYDPVGASPLRPIQFISSVFLAVSWFVSSSIVAYFDAKRHPRDASILSRYSHRLSAGFTRIFDLRHHIRTWERLVAHQPCIYIANHRSSLDVITMGEILAPNTVVIVKKELLKVPFLGMVLGNSRTIVIDRKNREDAVAGLSTAENAILNERLSVWVFPEGTRNFGTLKPFKRGAFHIARNTGVPIVPIACAVTPGWLVGRRLFVRRPVHVILEVLDPIDPRAFDSMSALVAHAEEVIAAALRRLEHEVREMG